MTAFRKTLITVTVGAFALSAVASIRPSAARDGAGWQTRRARGQVAVEFFKVDDESEPSKATDNVNELIKRDKGGVLISSVHSGVAMAMAKAQALSACAMVAVRLTLLGQGGARLKVRFFRIRLLIAHSLIISGDIHA